MLLSIVLFHVVDRLEMLMEATEDKGPHELVLLLAKQLLELISILLVEGVVVQDDSLILEELKVNLLP